MRAQFGEFFLQIRRGFLARMVDDFFGFQNPQIFERDRGANRMAAVSVAVRELAAGFDNRAADFVVDNDRAERQVAGSQAFRRRDKVRAESEMLRAEPTPQPPEAADDFVADYQNAVLFANLSRSPASSCPAG